MGRAPKNVLKVEEMRRLRVLGRSSAESRPVGEAVLGVDFPGFGIFSKLRLRLSEIWISKRRLRASEGVI